MPVLLQYCRELRESELNPKAALVALHRALQLGHLDTAETLLRALPELGFSVRPHYFWPIIIAAKRTQNLAGQYRTCRSNRGCSSDDSPPLRVSQ